MEVSDVMRDEETGSCADRCGEDRHVLRAGEFARPFTVVRCRMVDLERHRSEEFLEERGGLGEHQAKETKLTENQDGVACAGAGQQAGDQDVSVETDG
jgi:hypothetical protein